MKILDLFCGMGGWATGLIDAGHNVTGYDIADFSDVYPGKFIQVDLLNFNDFPQADVIVASPPCTEFSKASFPKTWKSVQRFPPDTNGAIRLFRRAYEIVELARPKYYIIENVRGAQKFMGKAREHKGSRYLWGDYPSFAVEESPALYGKWKMPPNPRRAELRSVIPYPISRAFAEVL